MKTVISWKTLVPMLAFAICVSAIFLVQKIDASGPTVSLNCEWTGIATKWHCTGTVTGAANPLRRCEWRQNGGTWFNNGLEHGFYCTDDMIQFRVRDYNWIWSNTATAFCGGSAE